MSSFYVRSYDPYSWTSAGDGLFVLSCDIDVYLEEHDDCATEPTKLVHFHVSRGATWDGASIPKPFRWYLPNIDESNLVYTLAGLLHDSCYASECLSKALADDLFRGVMRDAGIPRRKASFACWCVQHFADRHYGQKHDSHNLRNYVDMERLDA